jgi:RNA polymerase sigma-70 factor, ECF subfamily
MGTVLAAFVDALDEGDRGAFAGDAELEARLEAHHADARASWPTVMIDAASFAADVARRLKTKTPRELGACRAADLYLAIACTRAMPPAIDRFEAEILPVVAFAARQIGASTHETDDVRATVREQMLVERPGRRAGVAQFSGRSTLRHYVKVCAARELDRVVRRGKREVPAADSMLEALMSVGSDPGLAILRERYRAVVDAGFRAALAALGKRSRGVLQCSLLQHLPQYQIAKLYQVDPSTISRWLEIATEELGTLMRAEVSARLGVTPAEVTAIVHLVQSQLQLSFGALEEPAP